MPTLTKGILCVLMLIALLCLTFAQQKTTRKRTTTTTSTAIPAAMKSAAQSAASQGCDTTLLKHVYHPTRLKMIASCIEVTGTMHHTKPEADGDDHIQLRVDPQFADLLNDRNKTVQANSLIIEPVCQGPVTQPDAISSCRDFHSPVEVPARGTKVRVLGRFVLDTEADHGWTEIHPVTSITPQ